MTDLTDEAVKALLDGVSDGRHWVNSGRALQELQSAAPDLARALLDARADAQAAVALVVEQAALVLDDPGDGAATEALGQQLCCDGRECGCYGADVGSYLQWLIRALAPADGLAAVEALRVEARENAMQALASMGQAQEAYEAQLEAEAERDRLVAENAALEAKVAGLVAALDKARDPGRQPDYCYDDEWEYTLRFDEWQDLVDGRDLSEPVQVNTLFKGPTKWIVDVPNSRDEDGSADGWDTVMFDSEADARAALAQPPTEPGDGWTWNERLGWIGPDGKPADPRRRG